jgi:hypothetical protein
VSDHPILPPSVFEPGLIVRHPGRPDWGAGQVQSSIAGRVTVNFEHAGKVVIDATRVPLVPEYGA